MKTIKRVSMGIALCLTACMLLAGCGVEWSNYFNTDRGLKRVAAKSLEKKYGEKFIIHDVWGKNLEQFFADCSPKENPDVIFRADIYKNGKGVSDDGYTQGIVAKELNDILQDDFQALFPGCYTRVGVPSYYNEPEFENPTEVTLKEYMPYINFGIMGYHIFIPIEDASSSSISDEYDYLENTLSQHIKEGTIPMVAVFMYFVDEEMMEKCKEYYQTNSSTGSAFEKLLDGYVQISFGFPDGNINITYDEYAEKRGKVDDE